MALLDYVTPAGATGRAGELLAEYDIERGSLLRPMLANYPPLLEAQMAYHEKIMQDGSLDRELKELAGVVVSQANDCDYCASSHREKLHTFGIPGERLADVDEAEYDALSDRRRAAVEFAEQAATDPHRIGDDHLDSLRGVGFDDEAILELLGVVGMFTAANTYVNALSVHPTDRDVGLDEYLDPSALED